MKHDARTQAAIDAGHPEWAELLATRKEAATIAVTRYFTGKPCKHGHISARWSHGGNCAVCDEARRNQPEVKARVYALQKAYDQARKHEPKVVENRRAWARQYYSSKQWRQRLRDYHREYSKRDHAKDYYNAQGRKREAGKLNATPPWLNGDHLAVILAVYKDARCRTQATGVPHHVDHIVPLRHPLVCGLHVPWNLQILTAAQNLRKSNSFDGTMDNEGWRAALTQPPEEAARDCA